MVGLFPFPRVGRSDPDLIQEWDGSDFSLNSNEDYGGDDYITFKLKEIWIIFFLNFYRTSTQRSKTTRINTISSCWKIRCNEILAKSYLQRNG